MFLPRRKILEVYAKDTGTYLLRCYSKYHRAINTWRAAEESFWLSERHVGGCAQARSPSAHPGECPNSLVGRAQLMATLLSGFHRHPPPLRRTAADAQPYKGSFGQLPGRVIVVPAQETPSSSFTSSPSPSCGTTPRLSTADQRGSSILTAQGFFL